ncbi:response regulator transcription factor [Nocardioides ungokensis]|uniref:response regulator transcription factor n=1 Tax=Nocardioides ungokensis TaxID=1643322 RepID=UPI003CCE15AA
MARVLVVDDDHTVREVVVSYLRAHGHDVLEVGDGEAALVAMRDAPADLVVLDLMLPGIDGLEVCRRLRDGGDVPVIMLTALGAETDRVGASRSARTTTSPSRSAPASWPCAWTRCCGVRPTRRRPCRCSSPTATWWSTGPGTR